MSFIFRGRLCGDLCRDCREALSNVLVRIYFPQEREKNSDVLLADPKHTLAVLDEKTISGKQKNLIGEGQTDTNGNFEIRLKDNYEGGPIVVDVRLNQVPNQKSNEDKAVQFSITTLQPAWRGNENDYFFGWDYCLPYTFWCHIRELFDAWVICGHILSCEDNETPLVGVKVTAYDADWITDDLLGSATTDSSGHFRIDYTSKDFKQTFLSPIINVETPFSNVSGPDVYFVIESGGGHVIHEETRQDGKADGRRDIPNCFCIELCVDFDPGDDGIILASAWTGIGTAFTIPLGVDLNDFDAEGYASAMRYALTGGIRMTGQVAISSTNKVLQGNPYEYRFLVSDSTGVNGDPPLPAGNFTRIVGVDTGLFTPIKIGQMWYTGTPFKVVDIYSDLSDLDSEGWLDVNKSVERTFTSDPSLSPADLTDPTESAKWHWIDLDGMMGINTNVLTDNSMPSVAQPGDAVPVAQRKGIEKIAIRFELREVIDKASNNFNYLSGSGQTLNAAVVNNTPALMEFEIVQHLSGSSCAALSGDIDVAYTAHHPELEDVAINVRSNDNAINVNLSGPGLPVSNNTNPGVNHRNNASLPLTQAPNNVTLKTCAYIATLGVKRRLHNGDGGVSTANIQKAFYYEA